MDPSEFLSWSWPVVLVLAVIFIVIAFIRRHHTAFDDYTAPMGWRHAAGGALRHAQNEMEKEHEQCQQLTVRWHETRFQLYVWNEFMRSGRVLYNQPGFEEYLSMQRKNKLTAKVMRRIQSLISQGEKRNAA